MTADYERSGALKRDSAATKNALPIIYLARHGETAWTLTGQHTGLTDLPLTKQGERNALALGERLRGLRFARVFTSPLQRASRTCELAGFAAQAVVDSDLVEWNYGDYEGLLMSQILAMRPDWQLFRDGCPGGESPEQIGARARRFLGCVRNIEGNVSTLSYEHNLSEPVISLWNDTSYLNNDTSYLNKEELKSCPPPTRV